MNNANSHKLNEISVLDLKLSDLQGFLENILDIENTSFNNRLLITFNLDFLRISMQNKYFGSVCQNADYVVADGHGITRLIKFFYKIHIDRITGTDIFLTSLAICNRNCLKVAFVGSDPEVQETMCKKLSEEFPNCTIVAALSPSYNFENNPDENARVISSLQDVHPDVLFLALGCPRQESWLYKYKNQIGARLNVGIGGVFDFYSGRKKACPYILGKYGFEWLWRLVHEPRRLFKRYILEDIPFFIWLFLKKQL